MGLQTEHICTHKTVFVCACMCMCVAWFNLWDEVILFNIHTLQQTNKEYGGVAWGGGEWCGDEGACTYSFGPEYHTSFSFFILMTTRNS